MLRPQGLYRGPIKKLPKKPSKDSIYNYTLYGSSPNLREMPAQCAIKVMVGFPLGSYAVSIPREHNGRRNISKQLGRNCLIHRINETIDAYQEKGGWEEQEGSYLIATLNKRQHALGVGKILEEYFGFELMDEPFINNPHENDPGGSAIYLYGLCVYKFVKEE